MRKHSITRVIIYPSFSACNIDTSKKGGLGGANKFLSSRGAWQKIIKNHWSRWRRLINVASRRDFNSTVFRHDNIRGNTISKNTYLTEKTLSRSIFSTYCCVEMKISSHLGTFILRLINVGKAGWFDVYRKGWNDHHFHSS